MTTPVQRQKEPDEPKSNGPVHKPKSRSEILAKIQRSQSLSTTPLFAGVIDQLKRRLSTQQEEKTANPTEHRIERAVSLPLRKSPKKEFDWEAIYAYSFFHKEEEFTKVVEMVNLELRKDGLPHIEIKIYWLIKRVEFLHSQDLSLGLNGSVQRCLNTNTLKNSISTMHMDKINEDLVKTLKKLHQSLSQCGKT